MQYIKTWSGVFLTNFQVFHLVMKHCVKCLILLLNQNDFRRTKLRMKRLAVFHLISKHSSNINFLCIFLYELLISLRRACNKLMRSKYLDEINLAVIFRGSARFLPRIRKEKLLTTRLISTVSFIWISPKEVIRQSHSIAVHFKVREVLTVVWQVIALTSIYISPGSLFTKAQLKVAQFKQMCRLCTSKSTLPTTNDHMVMRNI